ncbi:hypothetical protein RFI_14990 [Reticulomyxa filosa]|uniref:Endonuclease/exonuclease/phosphatase domain-containing protein n=1 Tax=Reticulomyxa filosa TaxID=46433 RepID=X6N7E5_RETFI|nr:hypothetical protein RFI_14990 [Reticulomyxa filosa]|eukprot:ETO22210.1 hypothetical protein RFI_14990 [Reticulomyxa filosa]
MWQTYIVVGLVVGLGYVLLRTLYYFLLAYYERAYFTGKTTILFNGFDPIDLTPSVPPLSNQLTRGDILVRDFRDETAKKKIEQRFKEKSERQSIRIVTVNIEMDTIGEIANALKMNSLFTAEIITVTNKKIRKHFEKGVISDTTNIGYEGVICLQFSTSIKKKKEEMCKEDWEKKVFFCHWYIETLHLWLFFLMIEICNQNFKISKLFLFCFFYSPFFLYKTGNGILSKFDFVETKGLIVSCAREKSKHTDKTHTEAVAVCDIPHFGLLGCYCLHLDTNWTGVKGRVRQYLEILEDVSNQRTKYLKVNKNFHQVLGGDLNTLCCGLARFLPPFACNWYSSVGTLKQHIPFSKSFCFFVLFLKKDQYESTYFQKHGVEYGNKIYNLDFRDPFDKVKDVSFYALNGLYQAKLDWLLLSAGLKPTHWEVCPLDDKCSDHQWIFTDIELA